MRICSILHCTEYYKFAIFNFTLSLFLLFRYIIFTGALLISSGFTLNLIVCAMVIAKPSQGINEIPKEMTQQQRKKSFKSWPGYYFQNEEYCIDEDADKKEFFWNIKKLVSIHECPVAFEDYKMNTNNAINNIVENSNIKEGIILSVEGLNNAAYESSTDYLENVQQTHIEKLPTIINDTKHNNNDIVKNKMTNQNNINTKSTNNHNRKFSKQISKSGNNKMKRRASIMDKNVRESMKKKYKKLYKNVYFVLLLISLALFSFGTSIIFTHVLPYAESRNIS